MVLIAEFPVSIAFIYFIYLFFLIYIFPMVGRAEFPVGTSLFFSFFFLDVYCSYGAYSVVPSFYRLFFFLCFWMYFFPMVFFFLFCFFLDVTCSYFLLYFIF